MPEQVGYENGTADRDPDGEDPRVQFSKSGANIILAIQPYGGVEEMKFTAGPGTKGVLLSKGKNFKNGQVPVSGLVVLEDIHQDAIINLFGWHRPASPAIPRFYPGQRVSVHNYKKKNAEIWEDGEILGVSASWVQQKKRPNMPYLSYQVRLDRKRANGRYLILRVNSDGIREFRNINDASNGKK